MQILFTIYTFCFNSTYQEKMTSEIINSLALSLMDGTVFEIVRGLEDIQQLTERNLLNKRMKLINSQKGREVTHVIDPRIVIFPPLTLGFNSFLLSAERMEQNKTHKAAVDACNNKPHHLPVIKKKHVQEKENLESRLEQELVQLDQKLVLELDRVVADQQTTMQVSLNSLRIFNPPPQAVRVGHIPIVVSDRACLIKS